MRPDAQQGMLGNGFASPCGTGGIFDWHKPPASPDAGQWFNHTEQLGQDDQESQEHGVPTCLCAAELLWSILELMLRSLSLSSVLVGCLFAFIACSGDDSEEKDEEKDFGAEGGPCYDDRTTATALLEQAAQTATATVPQLEEPRSEAEREKTVVEQAVWLDLLSTGVSMLEPTNGRTKTATTTARHSS
jgi:hypothetical protein